MIHIIIEKVVIRITQPEHNVPGTSPEGPLKVLTFRIFRKLSEDQYKNWSFYEKIVFRGNSPCITYFFMFFQEEQRFKYSKRGRPRNVCMTQLQDVPWDQMMGPCRDVCATSVEHVIYIQSVNTLNVLWQVTQDLIVNGSSEKFIEQYRWLKNNLKRIKTWWVHGHIIKVWPEGPWLSFIFNVFKKMTLGRICPRYVFLNLFGKAYFRYSIKACNIAKRTCFEQGGPWHSGNYRVYVYSKFAYVTW